MRDIVNKSDIEKLSGKDGIFSFIDGTYGSPPNWKREQGFVSLSRIILEQQISLSSATAHFNKLNEYLGAFTPEEIVKLSDAEMRQCQISRQKTSYLRALASAVMKQDIRFDAFEDMDKTEVRRQLTGIKGIGVWTADIYLMFCLQEKDIFPFGDIAVLNAVRELSPVQTKDEISVLTEQWRPFRSLAAYYFWHYYLCKRNRTAFAAFPS